MEEDIKESINKFEEYLENVKSDDVHKNSMYNDNYGYVTMQFTPFSNKDIENLIARYKELKTHYEIICDDLKEHNLIYTDTPEFEENYIPKSKVQEKIEDYTEKSKHPLVNAQSRREYTFGIKALKELLED